MVMTIDARDGMNAEQEGIRISARIAQLVQVGSSLRKLAVLDVLLDSGQPMTIAGISEEVKKSVAFEGMGDTSRHNLVNRLLFQLETYGFLNQTHDTDRGSYTNNSLTDLGRIFLPVARTALRQFFEHSETTELFPHLKQNAIEDIVTVLLSTQRTIRREVYTIPEEKLGRSIGKNLGGQESETTPFIKENMLTDNGIRLADTIGSLKILIEKAEGLAASSDLR